MVLWCEKRRALTMMKCIYCFELNLRQMAPLLLEVVKRSGTPLERERCESHVSYPWNYAIFCLSKLWNAYWTCDWNVLRGPWIKHMFSKTSNEMNLLGISKSFASLVTCLWLFNSHYYFPWNFLLPGWVSFNITCLFWGVYVVPIQKVHPSLRLAVPGHSVLLSITIQYSNGIFFYLQFQIPVYRNKLSLRFSLFFYK